MTRPSPQADPAFLPASLAVSDVGTWDYDVPQDRMRYCRATATLYGLPPDLGEIGVPIDRLAAAIHPEDRPKGLAKRVHLLQHGGVFVVEYRLTPTPGVLRWVLLRGLFEPDETGKIARGRGIVVDVTESKQDGYADGDVFFLTEADERTVSALDRATRHLLAVRRALGELGPEADARLRSGADALLLDIAHHIAGTMVPVAPDRMKH